MTAYCPGTFVQGAFTALASTVAAGIRLRGAAAQQTRICLQLRFLPGSQPGSEGREDFLPGWAVDRLAVGATSWMRDVLGRNSATGTDSLKGTLKVCSGAQSVG